MRLAVVLGCLVAGVGCGNSPPAPEPTTSVAAHVGTVIGFGFLTSDARYTAVLPSGLSPRFVDYGVVTSPGAVMSIQYEPTSSYDLDLWLTEVRVLPEVEGGATPTLFKTKPRPVAPVLVWTLPSGTMWVNARHEHEVALLAAKMIVTEDQAGIPHVELLEPLTRGSPTDPSQREGHLLPQEGCEFIDAGKFAVDEVDDPGGVHMATVATPFGVTVRCSGHPDGADVIEARAETIAASITPVE